MTGPSAVSARPTEPRPAIGQVIETLGTGGAENLAIQIANALAARGWRSHLYVLSGPGELSGRVAPQVSLHYLHHRRPSILTIVPFAFSVARGLGRLRARVRADDVQVLQTHLPGANFWGLGLTVTGTCRSLATVHNNEEFSYGSRRGLRLFLRRSAYREMLRRCRAVVCVSDEVRASLVRELGVTEPAAAARAVVVANGVTVPPPLGLDARRRIRAGHGLQEDATLVLAVGRLCEQKNFGDLVAAAALLPSEGPPWRVLVAGEGPDRPELERRIAAAGLGDRFRLLGNVAAMSDLMRAADLFVLPSLWEGLPLSLLEAMAAALPVVGNRIKGIAEVVEPDGSALLVEPHDVAGLAAAIGSLLADPARRRRLGQAGLAIIKRDHDFERTMDRLEELYAAVLPPRA